MEQKKMEKIAGGLNRFLKVVKIVNLVSGIFALCGLAILMIGYAINPNGIVEPSVHTLGFGNLSIEILQGQPQSTAVYVFYHAFLILNLLTGLFLLYLVCGALQKILVKIVDGEPFHRSISDNIRKIAYVSLLWGIGDQLFQWIFDYFDFRYFGAEQLAQSEMIQSVNFTYRVNLWFLAGFFLLLLISHIFRYGSELQQLSDETL